MSLVFAPGTAFGSISITDANITDGEAIVTFGLSDLPGLDGTVANDAFDAFADAFGGLMWTSSTIVSCTVVNELTGFTSDNGPVTGTGPSSNTLIPSAAALLSKRGPGRGRRNRGRTFLPCVLAEASVFGDGTLDSSLRASLDAACNDWLTNINPTGVMSIPQGETQPRKDGTPGSPPILPWPPVLSMTCDPKAATQRRRMRR